MKPFWLGQESLSILQWALRAVVIYGWLLFITKLMGQRTIGRLTLFDFVVSISIGSVAGSALSTSTSGLLGPITTIATIGALNIGLAYLALKHAKFRRIVQEEPLVLVQNGRVIEAMLYKARYNLDDLLAELRQKNFPNLQDVEFAILEPTGKLSVIPKSQARPITTRDMQLSTGYEGLPVVVVEDGNILEDNLHKNGLNREWLQTALKSQGLTDVAGVMVATLSTTGQLYVSKKDADYLH